MWLLSGRGVFGDRFQPSDRRFNEQGRGSSIGIIGLVLAILSFVFRRREYGWVLLGSSMFVGNLVFILWHHRFDNLTFTIPGLIGISLLVGLGAGGPRHLGRGRRTVFQMACLIVPLFLLVGNP